MTRFFRLIKNEYIKLFSKVGTYVLLGVLVLSVVAAAAISLTRSNEDSYASSREQSYQHEADYYKETRQENYEAYVEHYSYLAEKQIPYYDWRTAAMDHLLKVRIELCEFKKDPEASKERIESREQYLDEAMAVIETGTWREFFEQALEWTESLELPAEEAERQTSLFNTILQYDLEPVENNELYTLARTMADQRQEMKALEADGNQNSEKEKRYQTLQEEIALAQYRLDHGLETIVQGSNTYWGSPDFWFVMDTVLSMVVLISVVMIIIGGSILSSEFSGGTIKFLLINPVKRSKIFLSKYVTVLSMGLGCVMLYYLLAVLVTGCFYGFGGAGAPYLFIGAGSRVVEIPGLLFLAYKFLLASVGVIVMSTLAFAISSLFKNTAVSVAVSVAALLGGNTLVGVLKQNFGFDWARFLLFANLDLNAVINEQTLFTGLTVTFALVVIAVHLVVFFLTAWDGFVRRRSI